MISAFDHIQLAVPRGGEDEARAYYVGMLGMAEIPKPPALAVNGGCWFTAGDVQLHVGLEDEFTPSAKAHAGIRVEGIAAFAQRLEERGAKVVWDDKLPGHRRFYSEDPFGNRLEFLEPTG